MAIDHDLGATGSSSAPVGERPIWKKLWKLEVPLKVRVFGWKVIKNGLPTRGNRCYRHLDQASVCEVCGVEPEDAFHAIITCPHATGLRHAMRDHWELPRMMRYINPGRRSF